MRANVELMHQITVLYNWAVDPRDTVSALSDKQAKEALTQIKALWSVLDRRQGKKK